jgi:hypothetical protein
MQIEIKIEAIYKKKTIPATGCKCKLYFKSHQSYYWVFMHYNTKAK